ncbi:MAG: sugar ABC transporter permease, partial [Candidatus Aureabacteria bacterium]|nr:sugar ABC transporter permease [Candidatus Auribacterota bacterium]
ISAYFFIEWGLMMKSISQAGSNLYLLPQAAVKEAGMLIMFSIILLFFGMFISLLAAFFRDRDLRFEKVSNVILSFLPALIIAVTVLPVWSFSNDIWQANDAYFWQYLGNTLFLMLGIPISMFASLGLAVLMNKKLRGIVFFRTIYFLPSICTGVALYVLWRWIYNTDLGLLNTLLGYIGIPKVEWLTDTALAKPSLMLMGIWTGVGGYNMILYLAGLQGIPLDIYEAADIDGASGWQKFWAVTWPMLSPTTFFIFIMSVIGGFQGGFDAAYIMTGGGPAGSTTTLSYYIFNNAYRWSKMGFAASIAWVLFALVFVVTLFNWKFGGKVVHY